MQWAAHADVIRLESEGSVRVHCSSNPDWETTSASFLESQEGSLFAQAHTTETYVIETSLTLNRLQRGQTSLNRLVL